MKLKLLLLVLLLNSLMIFSQSDFKKAYYIDNAGNRIEGYVKSSNFSSLNNDSFLEIDFKKDLSQKVQNVSKNSIIEIGIDSLIKIQKLNAKIDDVNLFKNYTSEKSYKVIEKKVFLNVIVEGAATLYSYNNGNGIKYLYGLERKSEIVKQLLYKKIYKDS